MPRHLKVVLRLSSSTRGEGLVYSNWQAPTAVTFLPQTLKNRKESITH